VRGCTGKLAPVTLVFGFLHFAMLNTGRAGADLPSGLPPADPARHPVRAAGGVPESFAPRLRYSSASLGYQFASVIAGGPGRLSHMSGTAEDTGQRHLAQHEIVSRDARGIVTSRSRTGNICKPVCGLDDR
jgi:hypothetical protein